MSYILDALKKANAEREHSRGALPGLHTQPNRATSAPPSHVKLSLKSKTTQLWTLAGALLLSAGILCALFWPAAKPLVSIVVPTPAAASATTTATALTPAIATPPPLAQLPQSPLPAAAPTVSAPIRVTPAPYNLSLPAVTPAATLPEAARQTPSPAVKQTHPVLPPQVRATMPALVVSGSTYSDNPAYRMLIINGQVYREGEFPIPGLKLEQIRQKSALLLYEGNTYALPY